MKKNDSLERLIKEFSDSSSIALFTHSRPDGDALGSVLALKFALEKLGKRVEAFCDTEIGHKYTILGYDKYWSRQPRGDFELFVALDCGDVGRLGAFSDFFFRQKNTLCIDHHYSHVSFCQLNYVKNCSSTCELVYTILNGLSVEIDKEIATALYIGLSTDTGNFSHGNTTPAVFEIAADLASKGIDIPGIYDSVYASSRFERTKLLGIVLTRMRRYFDGRLCLLYVTKADLALTGTQKDDTEGFIDYAINSEGAQLGVCFCEHSENAYKVSMRSKGLNVSAVCEHFGGGGHLQAAGCMISGLFEDAVDKLLKAIMDILWTDL